MSTLRVSNIEAKADVSSPTVDEKIKFTNSSGDVLFHLDGKTSGITTVGINTTGNTFTVNNTTGDVSFSGSVTSSGVSTFTSDVSIADKIVHIGDTDTAIRFPAADTITAETGGTERFRITSAGNVGIGTDTITGKVQIDTTSGGRALTVNAPTNGTYITFETNNTAYADIGSEAGAVGSGTNDLLVLNARSTRDLAFRTNSAERLRITSNGKVGIGSAIPTEILDVSGTGDMKMVVQTKSSGAGTNAGVRIATGDGYKWLLQVGDSTTSGGLRIYQETSGSNGERLRITSGGNMGLGVTPESWGTNFRAFQIGSTGSLASQVGARTIELATNAYNNSGWKYTDSDVASLYYQYNGEHIFANAPSGTDDASCTFTERLRIYSDGKIGIGDQAESSALLGIKAASTVELSNSSGLYNQSNPCFLQIKNSTDDISDPECGIILQPRNSSNGAVALFAKRKANFSSDLIYRVRTGSSTSQENLRFLHSGGITFNADTADANALDDYEEGTWNPSPSFGGGQTGLTGNFNGTYTKVGRLVMAQFQLTFTNKGSSTGTLAVAGLPFNIGTNYHNVSGFSYMHRLNMGQTGGQIHIGATGSTMWIRRAGYSGNDAVLLDNGDFTNTTALWGGITYHV